jgi:hypothetical protein
MPFGPVSTTHIEAIVADALSSFVGKPFNADTRARMLGQILDEIAFNAILSANFAIGTDLDQLGTLYLVERRPTEPDADYRARILAELSR